MNTKVLFVDDDVNLLEAVQRAMRKQFNIDTAIGGADGLQKLANSDGLITFLLTMERRGPGGGGVAAAAAFAFS